MWDKAQSRRGLSASAMSVQITISANRSALWTKATSRRSWRNINGNHHQCNVSENLSTLWDQRELKLWQHRKSKSEALREKKIQEDAFEAAAAICSSINWMKQDKAQNCGLQTEKRSGLLFLQSICKFPSKSSKIDLHSTFFHNFHHNRQFLTNTAVYKCETEQ